MHVASVMVFAGQRADPRRARRARRVAPASRAALPPAARPRAARPGPPGVDGRPPLQPLLPHPPHRAAEAGRRRGAEAARRAAVLAAARPLASRCGRSGSCRASSGNRFALIAKTHHALVDGISGVDITTVLFDTAREPAPTAPASPWSAKPLPGAGEAARRGAASSARRCRARCCAARGRCCALRAGPPRRSARASSTSAPRRSRACARRRRPAPSTSRSARTAATRSSTPTSARFKAIKDSLGGTLNDAVLTSVTLALGRYLRRKGMDTDGLVLKAMVPVSVRSKAQRGRARQPGRRDVGAAAGRDRVPGRGAARRSPPRWRTSRNPARRSARRC